MPKNLLRNKNSMATQKHYTPEEAQQRYDALPQATKDMLYSIEMLTIVRGIGQKYGLHVDQVGLLQAEASAVMLGFTDTADFSVQLAEALHVASDQAEKIAADVDAQLFSSIRATMKQSYEEQRSSAAPVASTPAAAAAPTPKPVELAPIPASKTPEIHPADMMLSQKTVSATPTTPPAPQLAAQTPPATPSTSSGQPAAPKAAPQAPKSYTNDPYREPPV